MKLAVQRDSTVLLKTGTWNSIIMLEACFKRFYNIIKNQSCGLHFNVSEHVRELRKPLAETAYVRLSLSYEKAWKIGACRKWIAAHQTTASCGCVRLWSLEAFAEQQNGRRLGYSSSDGISSNAEGFRASKIPRSKKHALLSCYDIE